MMMVVKQGCEGAEVRVDAAARRALTYLRAVHECLCVTCTSCGRYDGSCSVLKERSDQERRMRAIAGLLDRRTEGGSAMSPLCQPPPLAGRESTSILGGLHELASFVSRRPAPALDGMSSVIGDEATQPPN